MVNKLTRWCAERLHRIARRLDADMTEDGSNAKPVKSDLDTRQYDRKIEEKDNRREALGILAISVFIALLGALLLTALNPWKLAWLYVLALSYAGGLVGFLFGLPKRARPSASSSLTPNTNLEQISDWLTTVIVGIGLVQLGHIPSAIASLSDFIAPGFVGANGLPAESVEIYVVGMIVFFPILGFLAGYLWTRLYIAKVIGEGEEPSSVDNSDAQVKDAKPPDRAPLMQQDEYEAN